MRLRIAMALPLEVEDRLAPTAIRHGHEVVARCSSAAELAARIDAVQPDVAVVASTERHLTERLLAVCDEAGVRVIALVETDDDRRHAADIGLFETAGLQSSWLDIQAELAVSKAAPAADVGASEEWRAAGNREVSTAMGTDVGAEVGTAMGTQVGRLRVATPKLGTVIAVWGPAGSPGRTTLAINIAAELAAAGHSVALGDVDTHSGSVAPALGLLDEAPGFAAACRLAGTESLTQAELERIGQRYRSGHASFWVLTGIGRPSRWPELSAARVASTIAECRTWVEFTVLDTGASLENDEEISSDLFAPRRNAATITALREADWVVAVGAADPVGMSRFLRAHVDLVETVAAGRVIVAMNKVRASAIGMNPSGQVAQTLSRFGGIESAVMIPFDHSGLDGAILAGKTLADAAPKSPVRVAIRELVTQRILPNLSLLGVRQKGTRRVLSGRLG
jgi:MinD-like ATPase involved in chromosome partitioning or flagellar assembly